MHICTNPNNSAYKHYGARGITFSEAFIGKEGLKRFIDELGGEPRPAMTLHLIDNDKGYEPGNIRWATYLEQAQPNNRRNNHSGRPRIGRVTVTVRLFPKTQTLLKRAAKAAKIEQGRYIEKVLLAQFEQEGIQ